MLAVLRSGRVVSVGGGLGWWRHGRGKVWWSVVVTAMHARAGYGVWLLCLLLLLLSPRLRLCSGHVRGACLDIEDLSEAIEEDSRQRQHPLSSQDSEGFAQGCDGRVMVW